jgi:hypothetical protein
MSSHRRWILSGVAGASGVVLVVVRVLGYLTSIGTSELRFTGFVSGPGGAVGRLKLFGHADWGGSALVAVVVVIFLVAAVYLGVGGLDAQSGAAGAFVIGWGSMVLAAGMGEAMRALSRSSGMFNFSVAPVTGRLVPSLSIAAAGYGLFLGWIVGLALVIAFMRTRPVPTTPP